MQVRGARHDTYDNTATPEPSRLEAGAIDHLAPFHISAIGDNRSLLPNSPTAMQDFADGHDTAPSDRVAEGA
jgi:hypothetical protein